MEVFIGGLGLEAIRLSHIVEADLAVDAYAEMPTIGRGDRHLSINKHNPGTHDYRLENIVFCLKAKFFCRKFGGIRKKPYLCNVKGTY